MPVELKNYYFKHTEPIQSCLLALKDIILSTNAEMEERRKFQIPFFYYKNKTVCFLWVRKKAVVFGMLKDKTLQKREGRLRISDQIEESFDFNPNEDLPIETILNLLHKKIKHYNKIS